MRTVCALFVALVATLLPGTARAQWYVAGYSGANATHAADIAIDQPSNATALRLDDVTFAAKPMQSPQYYGIRIGRLVGARAHWGAEVEFIHLKVFAETTRPYRASGTWQGAPIDERVRMDTLVQRYDMSHGLNFLLINLVSRRPIGSGRTALVNRVGAGVTIPHAETQVGFEGQQQYETAGAGGHASSGVDIRLTRWMSAMIEYKLTAARPVISLAGGTGRTTSVSHHAAIGFVLGARR